MHIPTTEEIMSHIGAQLGSKHLKMKHLAERCSLTPQHLSNVSKGKANLSLDSARLLLAETRKMVNEAET